MTVEDLQKILHTLPKDAEVILSRDEEGDQYSPLNEVLVGVRYIPDNAKCGEIELEGNDGIKAVVLYPV